MINGPQGYKKLITWQNAAKLRRRVYEITKKFPRCEYRRVIQMNDAARSIKQNIQEGYGQPLGKYINFLKNIAQPSLHELHGDIEDSYEDKLISEEEFKELDKLCGTTDYLLNRQVQGLEKRRNDIAKNKHSP